jgi:hypothetical protein
VSVWQRAGEEEMAFFFFKAEGRRLAFVGWELGFSGGAAAVWCVKERKWGLP